MRIITVIKRLPAEPSRAVAKQQVAAHMNELMALWIENHGAFIAGSTFHFLAFRPGEYAAAKAGVVRNSSALESKSHGDVQWAFALSDDPAALKSGYVLWTLRPDPEFWPGEGGKSYKRGGGPIPGSA